MADVFLKNLIKYITHCKSVILFVKKNFVSLKAFLWDLRMKRVLVEYKGMKNKGTRIPVYMDDAEKLVYGCKFIFILQCTL